MSRTTVEHILHEIQELSDEDRELFEQELAQIEKAEWKRQVQKAGEEARARGIDQEVIDRTIEKLRYG